MGKQLRSFDTLVDEVFAYQFLLQIFWVSFERVENAVERWQFFGLGVAFDLTQSHVEIAEQNRQDCVREVGDVRLNIKQRFTNRKKVFWIFRVKKINLIIPILCPFLNCRHYYKIIVV